jgi:hypothetical protein
MSELIHTEHVSLTSVGLTFLGTVSFDEWLGLMSTLVRMETAFQFAIGDALIYGESKFGEKYSQAMDATGLSYQTLANLTWVSKHVPLSNRIDGVSWTHHRVVASVDPCDQRDLLEMARDSKMSATDLSHHITGRQPRQKNTLQVPDGMTLEQATAILDTHARAIREANTSIPPAGVSESDAVLTESPLCHTCPYRVSGV